MFKFQCRACGIYKVRTLTAKMIRVDENGFKWSGRVCPSCTKERKKKLRLKTCSECYCQTYRLTEDKVCKKCDIELGTFKIKDNNKKARKCLICKNDCDHNYFYCFKHEREDLSYYFNYAII